VAASQHQASRSGALIIRRPFWIGPGHRLIVVQSSGLEPLGSVDLVSLSSSSSFGVGGKLAALSLSESSSFSSSSSSLHLCPNSPASLASGGGGEADDDAWAQCWAIVGSRIVRLGL
jgi:hypothetical protein